MNRISQTFILRLLSVIAIGMGGSAMASAPFPVSSETTKLTGPLLEDGRIDYVAALNERFGRGVTVENNGYVVWLRAVGFSQLPSSIREKTVSLLGAQGVAGGGSGWEAYDGQGPLDQSSVKMWKEDEYPRFAVYLKRQGGSLDLVHDAAAAPRWWTPTVSLNGTVRWVLLPELNSMREISTSLCGRALLRARQGDFDGFLSDVTAVKRLARRAAGWTIIGHLVAVGIDTMADQTIGATAGAGIFSGDQCAKLGKMLDGLEPMPSLWESVDLGERWSTLDSVQCIAMGKMRLFASGNGNNDPSMSPLININTHAVDWDAVITQLNGNYDEIVSILKSPSVRDEQIARQVFEFKRSQIRAGQKGHVDLTEGAGETKQVYTQRVADAIFLALSPSIWRAEDRCRVAVTLDQATGAMVAAARYYADKGNWPDTLDGMGSGYLANVPTDIFSGSGKEPVRYQKTDGGICLFVHAASGGVSPDITIGIVQEQAPTEGL